MKTSIKSDTDRTSERILARQLARELTQEELQFISGGQQMVEMAASISSCNANSSSVTTFCTVCCDCDGGADD
jgi:hypothetical protein